MNKYWLQSDLQDILKVMYRDLLDVYHNSDHNIEKSIYLGKLETIRDCLCKINEAEAADVMERKRGEWVDTGFENSTGKIYLCSACNKANNPNKKDVKMGRVKETPDFCPNCGADMRGEKNAVD